MGVSARQPAHQASLTNGVVLGRLVQRHRAGGRVARRACGVDNILYRKVKQRSVESRGCSTHTSVRYHIAAALVLALAVLAGCAKREEQRLQPKAPVAPQAGHAETGVTGHAQQGAGVAEDAAPSHRRTPALTEQEKVVAALAQQQKVMKALDYARAQSADLLTLSNMLADVSSKDIMAVVVPMQQNCEYADKETQAIMKIYEVVRARGAPGWAVLFCTLQLSRFERDSMTKEGFERGVAMLRECTLSANPSKTEKQTYATIQISLLGILEHDPPEQLKQIERIEHMVREGFKEFPQQPLEYMVLEKASCYYWLGRDEEARALIEGLYQRYKAGTLSPDMSIVFDKGLEHAIAFRRDNAKFNRKVHDNAAQGKAFWED